VTVRPPDDPYALYHSCVIIGLHTLIYSADADADRAFLRDVLGFEYVDAGHGWLIFSMPPTEMGVHPTDGPGSHEMYLMCDDIEATVAELTARGVAFTQPPTDAGFGRIAMIRLPGGGELGIYQPRHATAFGAN
jgi:predicted enzyme related to lactoylglutathione lyase